MSKSWKHFLSILLVACCTTAAVAAPRTVEVADDAGLRAAVAAARAGDRVRIAPGTYQPGIYLSGLKGTAQRPVFIEGADPASPPVFEGGNEAWHLSDCAYVVLRNLALRRQTGNGINIDDGGDYETPTHHIILEKILVSDTGPKGNHDAIKLSGLDDFVVRRCTIEGWAGQAVDMVGCHRGLVEECVFRGKPGFSQHTGPQMKGGSSEIVIRRCLFDHAGERGVQLGGSTGMAYFRPKGALYEAKDLCVEGCTFVGSEAPLAFVGVDGAVVRQNTFYRPEKWLLRILQETTGEGFVPCRNGRFEGNLVVFRRGELRVFVNVGPHTLPETFPFSGNLWYCEDRPTASKPQLPTAETGAVYGVDPRLEDPAEGKFTPQNPEATRFGASTWQPQNGNSLSR